MGKLASCIRLYWISVRACVYVERVSSKGVVSIVEGYQCPSSRILWSGLID